MTTIYDFDLHETARCFVIENFDIPNPSVGDRSFAVLVAVVGGALSVDGDLAMSVNIRPNGTVLYYAGILLGDEGDEKSLALFDALRFSKGTIRKESARMVEFYFQEMSPRERKESFASPLNKVVGLSFSNEASSSGDI